MALFGNRALEGTDVTQAAKLGTVDPLDPAMQAQLLTRTAGTQVIGKEEIRHAVEILREYKQGKANLETRVVEDELWYQLRHWEAIRRKSAKKDDPTPSSAWLFNALANKHADAMDNFPEPVTLPREQSDEESAKILSSVLPVIFEQNEFEDTYSAEWWEKLKHGTACYGVFWNSQKDNGLGDVDIKGIDLLNLFWEPGVTDIQDSRNVFIVALEDTEALEKMYPQFSGKLPAGGKVIDVKEYLYDDTVDTSKKSVVVDWYYKLRGADGRTVLHYVKFVGEEIIYASENDPQYAQRGYYDHGLYPVVLDTLFPEKGTPVGYGMVAICKDPQLYIDRLLANILQKSLIDTKQRYFVSNSTNVNEAELLDVHNPVVHVEGDLEDRRIKEIVNTPLNGIYLNVLQQRVEEMKDTASNRDVSSGGSPGGGVTAASAIAALQEAGNKVSRDMIKASYRTHTQIVKLVIEIIRQFYDEARSFRITMPNGTGYEFVNLDNSALGDQVVGMTPDGTELIRKPIFDIKVKSQKKNPFAQMEMNERAMNLYSAGFFNPEMAQQSLGALEMMDFEGIDKVREYVQNGQTLLQQVQQLQAQLMQMQAALGMAMGAPAPGAGTMPQAPAGDATEPNGSGGVTGDILQARTPMTSYGERLAKRSVPSVEG